MYVSYNIIMKYFVALVALGMAVMVQGYSNGAPAEECGTMTPRHHVDPQKGASPYDITLSKRSVRAGESVEIRIKGKRQDDLIKGLLVQARVGETPIGKFDVSSSRQYIQTLSCGQSINNAVTHKKISDDVNEVIMTWTAPANLKERVVFQATIAKNGGVFWVAQKSDVLSVN